MAFRHSMAALFFLCVFVLFPGSVSSQDEVLLDVDGGSGDGENQDGDLPPECTPEFQGVKGHTMCMQDNPNVVKTGVTRRQRNLIVNLHNTLRCNVLPSATDLPKMAWDDSIAAIAQKWSQQCIMGHDKERKIPSYGLFIGQNAAGGFKNWRGAILAWYNEVNLFQYGKDPATYLSGLGGWKAIGHFTQIVQNTTTRVGCGFSKCNGTELGTYYICNYARGQSRIKNPYTAGDRCSDCPDSCVNGLCDCLGKLCLNGGTLDVNNCTCSCRGRFRGPSCETYVPPETYVSSFNCTFVGDRPSKAQCQAYGKNGEDRAYCASQGGRLQCVDCITYSNVQTEYCPVMCGYCAEPCEGVSRECENNGQFDVTTCRCQCLQPFIGDRCEERACNGKICSNQGKLDLHSCTCQCLRPYQGDTCNEVKCPAKDSESCWSLFKPSHCSSTRLAKIRCPWMCGLCGQAGATPPPGYGATQRKCPYTGPRPSKEKCLTYGNNGADHHICSSLISKLSCRMCTEYSNIKKDYCPVMCGYCD